MKRWVGLLIGLALLTGCSTSHMIQRDSAPDLVAKPDSALLVIIRNNWLGGGVVFKNYLDRKLIGETFGQSYFVTHVPPGPHHVIGLAENAGVARFDFKPAKVYFLQQGVTVGVWSARTSGFFPMTPPEAREAMEECTFYEYDPATGGEDLNEEVYRSSVEGYEQGIREDPEGYRELLGYDGF